MYTQSLRFSSVNYQISSFALKKERNYINKKNVDRLAQVCPIDLLQNENLKEIQAKGKKKI